MIDWLGIDHLFELSTAEAIAGFFTPLAIFAAFFLAQVILPGRRVPGYVTDEKTGQPRQYRLNGLLVFLIAIAVWAFELIGMPRDWFYAPPSPRWWVERYSPSSSRSSPYSASPGKQQRAL